MPNWRNNKALATRRTLGQGRGAFPAAIAAAMGIAVSTTAIADQPFQLRGIHNFRDIGGYSTADGKTIKRGLLYRSADLGGMTPEDRQQLDNIGIRYELDLRCPDEIKSRPSIWGNHSPSVFTPYISLCDPTTDSNGAEAPLSQQYAEIAFGQAANIAWTLRKLTTAGAPALVHCTAGNDRTGITIAIFMKLLGASLPEIDAEYLKSNNFWKSAAGRREARVVLHQSRRQISSWPGLQANTINQMFILIDRKYGSFDHYASAGLKLTPNDIIALRNRYLQ